MENLEVTYFIRKFHNDFKSHNANEYDPTYNTSQMLINSLWNEANIICDYRIHQAHSSCAESLMLCQKLALCKEHSSENFS